MSEKSVKIAWLLNWTSLAHRNWVSCWSLRTRSPSQYKPSWTRCPPRNTRPWTQQCQMWVFQSCLGQINIIERTCHQTSKIIHPSLKENINSRSSNIKPEQSSNIVTYISSFPYQRSWKIWLIPSIKSISSNIMEKTHHISVVFSNSISPIISRYIMKHQTSIKRLLQFMRPGAGGLQPGPHPGGRAWRSFLIRVHKKWDWKKSMTILVG